MADGPGVDVLQELDTLLLEQAREGKVTAAVALYRHVQARLKGALAEVKADDGPDMARPVREIIAELEAEIAALKDQLRMRT